MESGPGPLPPASHPPHLTTAPPKSTNLAAKRQSTPSSSPTPSRHLISSQQSLPERPQPSFDNGLVSGRHYVDVVISHSDLREQDIYPDIRLTHPEQTPISPKKPDLGYYSSVDRSQNMLDNGRLEEVEGCYSRLIISDLMPISEKSKSSDILADPSSENSQSSDNLLDLSFSEAEVIKTSPDCLIPAPISPYTLISDPPSSATSLHPSLLDFDDLLNMKPSTLTPRPKLVKRNRQKKVSIVKPDDLVNADSTPEALPSKPVQRDRPKKVSVTKVTSPGPPPLPNKRKSVVTDPLFNEVRRYPAKAAPRKPERPKGLVFPSVQLEDFQNAEPNQENPYSDIEITLHSPGQETIESTYTDIEIKLRPKPEITVPYESVELLSEDQEYASTSAFLREAGEKPPIPLPFRSCPDRMAIFLDIQRSRNVTITPAEDNAYSTILDNQSGSDQTGKLTSPRFDEDNYSELSIPHSDVTDGPSNIPPSSGDDDEDEDVYETFDDKASKSKEKVEKTNSKVPSVSKKSKSSKGFGFKGLLANISDNAHSASQNLKTKSQNMNIKSLTGSNNTASVYQDLPDMQYESEFGKRTGTPRGPREMPSHWIQI